MANNFRMNLDIPSNLSIRLKEIKIEYKINYAEIFVLLISQIPRPKEFQSNYKVVKNGKTTRHFDIRMDGDQKIKINTFAAAFKNLHHSIDYLLDQEEKIKMNRITLSI